MSKYRLIIFDLIDTLAYCKGLPEQSTQLEQMLGKETIDRFIDGGSIDKVRSVDEAIEKFKSIAPLTSQQEELVRKWLSWPDNYLFDDSVETLKYLKNEDYKIAIISNSPPTDRDQLLDLGIKEYVDEAVYSFEVGSRKPEREIFLNVLERFGVDPSEALMIGDSIKSDVGGARGVDMDSLLLDRADSVDYQPKITNLLQLRDFLSVS